MKNHNLYLSTDKGAALWFQLSGALSMYYLFAGQVKCMHTLPPDYNGTRQNKLRTSKNNLLIPKKYHIFVQYHKKVYSSQTQCITFITYQSNPGAPITRYLHGLMRQLAQAKVLPLPTVVQQSINGLKQHCSLKTTPIILKVHIKRQIFQKSL